MGRAARPGVRTRSSPAAPRNRNGREKESGGVSRARRLLGAIDPAEAVSAGDMQDAIATLNNLGQRWLANGLLAAWTDVSLPTDSLTSPVTATDALSDALALKVAPEYAIEP